MPPDKRKAFRDEHIKPIFQEIKDLIDSKSHLRTFDTKVGKAINYALNHWSELMNWENDGCIELDNNLAEQMIKKFVMARKIFLFSNSVVGAKALCLHFSLLATAQIYKLDLRRYYAEVLRKIPTCKSENDYDALLPWNIQISTGI